MNVSSLRIRRQYSLFSATAFFTLLIALPASAQDQSPSADNPPMEEIVVTGSHIARTDLETTVPVVSLSTAQIQATGITNLAQSLNQ